MSAYDLLPAGTRVAVSPNARDEIGDRCWQANLVAGMRGTVVPVPEDYFNERDAELAVGVEFDLKLPRRMGHECGGGAAEGHGWNVLIKHLTKLQPETPEFQAWCELDQEEDT